VETRFEPALPAVIGQSSYITQTVANLLSNAAKYGSPGEPVVVSARASGTHVAVAVTNPGERVLGERLDLLVRPFYRDAATRTTAPGLGLGLSVCRRLVEAQNGVFEITAPVSGGLRASFTLRLAPDT
jgi:signal transduction histidine kinase